MPFTVITLKKVPSSLRGDLTKWMQEIATGVYVGNFNSKVREQLWKRITQSASTGEVTMSYVYQNEIGYQFKTINAERKVVDYDGIPLVMLPIVQSATSDVHGKSSGYSDASKFRKAKTYSNYQSHSQKEYRDYVVVDIETDGLDYTENSILEIGAIKLKGGVQTTFHRLIEYESNLPPSITKLTGITAELLKNEGQPLRKSLNDFVNFIDELDIVGYGTAFDLSFLNRYLKEFHMDKISNNSHDLMRYVKREKMFLKDFKLKTVLASYEMDNNVPHRALEDAIIIYDLSLKVNKFLETMDKKR